MDLHEQGVGEREVADGFRLSGLGTRVLRNKVCFGFVNRLVSSSRNLKRRSFSARISRKNETAESLGKGVLSEKFAL